MRFLEKVVVTTFRHKRQSNLRAAEPRNKAELFLLRHDLVCHLFIGGLVMIFVAYRADGIKLLGWKVTVFVL